MSFSTMEQLRSKAWPTKEAALKDLRSNGFKVRGADYEIRETSSGVWQIMDLEAANNDNDTAAKKPASRKSSRKAAAASVQPDPEPSEEAAGEPAPTPADVAEEVAEELAAQPQPDPGLFPELFELVLGERLRRDAATAAAEDIARNAGIVVQVRAADGAVVHIVEPPSRPAGTTTTRQDVPLTELAKACMALAKREQGAKRTELSALNNGVVINWKGYLDRVGKREGLTLTVERSGSTPVYFLK